MTMSAVRADTTVDRHAHVAAFYDAPHELAVSVADFVAPALTGDGAALVIASPEHHLAFRTALQRRALDPDADRYHEFDAHAVLEHLMDEGAPVRDRWRSLLGGLITPHVDAGRPVSIVAVIAGEMEDRDEFEAAILVEELAEELAAELPFSLLCCYRIGLFGDAEDQLDALRSICAVHAGLITHDPRVRTADDRGADEAAPGATNGAVAAVLHEQTVARARELEALRREHAALRTELIRVSELEDAQQRFTAMVIHDIRTPTSVIAGLTGVLQNRLDELGPDRVQDFLETVVRNADRIERLLDDILTVARLESQGFRYQLEDVDLGVVAEEARDQTQAATGRQVHVHLADELPLVRADTDRQLQILHNLLSNAAKFSASGTPIEVGLRHRDGEMVVTVRDEGRGIAPEDHDKLFEPFARLESRAVDKVGGTGLGLYVTKLLVEGQGGRIEVMGVPDAGTTVTYTVPCATS
jgi:signal transduction histidine kinase